MFTKKVTDDDNFMALSSSAQALYLHLSMAADDDGFCNQVSISMFKAHASIQDLQALLEKRYIYQFDNGVIVIKHWRMANALRKDRYTPTAFQEELSHLDLKKNGSYTWLPSGCQVVAEQLPQDRLDKDSIGKDNIIIDSASIEAEPTPQKTDYQQIFNMYHKICTSFPVVRKNTDARKKAIKARLNTYSIDDFKTLFENAEASDFLKGANDRNWQATFDWLIKDANMAKVLEGNYDNRQKQQTRRNSYNSAPQRQYDMDAMERMLLEQNNPAPTVDDDADLKAEAEELQRKMQEKYAKSV